MKERYAAEAALNFEGDPSKQEYCTCYGKTPKQAVDSARSISVTGDAYALVCEIRNKDIEGGWEVSEYLDADRF